MLDAYVGSWTREAQMPPEMLDSVRELNHRFLDLVGSSTCGWSSPLSTATVHMSARVAPLSEAEKAAASKCPYALFDLRFHDENHWRDRLRTGGTWSVADTAVDSRTLEFARVALFFAWHVAATARFAAQLILGMSEATAAAFRAATVDCLPSLAAAEAVHLTARWNDCPGYWGALLGAASRSNAAELRRIQLYGLQLTAAARLG